MMAIVQFNFLLLSPFPVYVCVGRCIYVMVLLLVSKTIGVRRTVERQRNVWIWTRHQLWCCNKIKYQVSVVWNRVSICEGICCKYYL